jgi:hypothetical protein
LPNTITIDRFSLDVFEYQEWVRAIEYASVNESRDIRVVKTPEHSTLAAEPLLPQKAFPARVQEFDRYSAFEPIIGAPRAPHASHAAPTNFGLDDVGTDMTAHQTCAEEATIRVQQRLCEESREALTNARRERMDNGLCEFGVAERKSVKP